MPDAFFDVDGDLLVPTALTRGPWSNEHQHGGPPCALIARAVRLAAPRGMAVARLTFEIRKPVPMAPLSLRVEEQGGGKRVRLFAASLTCEGVELVRAAALCVREASVTVAPSEVLSPPRSPAECEPFVLPFFRDRVGYHVGMELRFASGQWGSGPTRAWMRMRAPLVRGEEPAPLERVVIAADSGNGVSPIVDPRTHLFVNPDLTVHVERELVGEWVCLDAATSFGPSGRGLATCRLWDELGAIGTSCQTLLLEVR